MEEGRDHLRFEYPTKTGRQYLERVWNPRLTWVTGAVPGQR